MYFLFPQTGLTALHVAASYGQEDFVREMLTQVPATITSERPSDNPDADVSSLKWLGILKFKTKAANNKIIVWKHFLVINN